MTPKQIAGRRFSRNCPVALPPETRKQKPLPTRKKHWNFGLNPRPSSCIKARNYWNSPCREPAISSSQREGSRQSFAQARFCVGRAIRQPSEMAARKRTAGDCGHARQQTHSHRHIEKYHRRQRLGCGRFPLINPYSDSAGGNESRRNQMKADGLSSCIHFGMDDWGNWRLNILLLDGNTSYN